MPDVPASIAILSPHLDDAVLSCWHLLSGPGEVVVINLFAGMPPEDAAAGWWDEADGAGPPREVVAMRLAEDRAALALAGREAVNLLFLDRQYRSADQPLAPVLAAVRDLVPAGATVIGPAALASMPEQVSVPKALRGPHPDHLVARSIALELRAQGFAAGLYADLPHASAKGLPDWVAHNDSEGPSGVAVAGLWRDGLVSAGLAPDALTPDVFALAPEAFAGKLAALERYASQLAPLERAFGRRLLDPALLGYEVAWWLGPLAASEAGGSLPASSASAAARKR